MSKIRIISIITAILIALIIIFQGNINKIFPRDEKKTDSSTIATDEVTTHPQINLENGELTEEKEVFTVAIGADYAIELNSTEKIANAAEVMIEGEVTEANSFTINNNDLPQVVTLVKVKVIHDYMEQIPAGKEIYFLQHGGTVMVKIKSNF